MTFPSQNNPLSHADMPTTVAEMNSPPLGAAELLTRLKGKLGSGLYRPPFTYQMHFHSDGVLWGRNNYGTEDTGRWAIAENGEMVVSWQNYWDAHTTRIYEDSGILHLFDTDTGNWRSCLVIAGA